MHTRTKCVLDFEGHAPPSILNISNSGFNPIHSMSQLTSRSLYKTANAVAKYQTDSLENPLVKRVLLLLFYPAPDLNLSNTGKGSWIWDFGWQVHPQITS